MGASAWTSFLVPIAVGALIPFFILAPLLGFAWYFALKGAAGLFQHVAPGTRFLVRPTPLEQPKPAGSFPCGQ
jgi:hypothetical protein